MSARDDVIGNKDAEKIRERLANAPSSMAMDDVSDLLEVCYVHLNITPVSIREVQRRCQLMSRNGV